MSALALILIISCHHEEHHENPDVSYKVTGSLLKDTIINKEYVSQIHAYQHIELRALEKGYLQKILVDEGQLVKKGQLLFQIQPTIYEAEAQIAASEVAFAQVEFENIKALSDMQIVSENELALAKAKLDKAKAELLLAKAHLQFTEVRAPFDGIVGKFEDVRLGSLLDEGELLTTLSDNSKMWVYFNVPEAEYLNYIMQPQNENELVYLRLANNELFNQDGHIETIESDFNNSTGNIAFRATFSNPLGILRHGQTGNILWPKPLHKVMMIPQKATFEILDKKFIFLVDEEGVLSAKEIKIEGELNHVYFVGDGLKTNDKFLLEGLRKVKAGEKVKINWISPDDALKSLALHAE